MCSDSHIKVTLQNCQKTRQYIASNRRQHRAQSSPTQDRADSLIVDSSRWNTNHNKIPEKQPSWPKTRAAPHDDWMAQNSLQWHCGVYLRQRHGGAAAQVLPSGTRSKKRHNLYVNQRKTFRIDSEQVVAIIESKNLQECHRNRLLES